MRSAWSGIGLLACLLLAGAAPSPAQVRGTIVGPASRNYPIALSPLKNVNDTSGRAAGVATQFADILGRDLQMSGLFRVIDRAAYIEKPDTSGVTADTINFDNWSVIGALALVKGTYALDGERVTVEARLFDVYQRRQLAGRRYYGTPQDVRRMAHKFADEVMLQFTGERGPFDSRIAFISTRGGRFKDVYVMSLDGGDVLQVTRTQSINLSPAWSPDVRALLYTSYKRGNPDLYALDFVNGRETRLTMDRGLHLGGKWSPDGRSIAVTVEDQGNTDIALMDPRGRLLRRLTNYWGIDVSPTWSPDGRQIAFCSDRSGSPQIYVMSLDGGEPRRITFLGSYNTSPAWSPKGDRIAYASRMGMNANVFTIGPDGSNAYQVTADAGSNEDPAWSPDGRYLVFSSTRSGKPRLYMSDASGSQQLALTESPGGDTNPSWSVWME